MTQAKEMIFDEEARSKLSKGIKELADVVGFTLGPQGRNVGLEKAWGPPSITNDGGSVVDDISMKDKWENMGASMAKEVVQKIKEACGDGTTTGTLLFKALVENGVKQISAGASPIDIKRGIDKAVDQISKALEKDAIEVKGSEEIKNIATVSASGNKEVGEMIAKAMDKAGKNGVITIEESKSTEDELEIVEGMQFDRGWVSPYFATNAEKMITELENPYILIVDKKIVSVQELLPLLQAVVSGGKALLIIAEDFEGDVLSTLVVNRLRGSLKVAAVKAPGFGDRRKAMLKDIAILVGAQVISEEAGMSLKETTPDALGSSDKVVITKDKTTIIGGAGSQAAIKGRVQEIEHELKNTSSKYDKEKLEERKAKLSGGVAVIKVGGYSEPVMKQKKQMFEDALNSTKAAVEEGIVAGGGVALLRASQTLVETENSDEAFGAKIVKKACETPLRQIAQNSGLDGSVVLSKVLEGKDAFGFNAETQKMEDLIDAGVVDPIKVVRLGLVYAAAQAGVVLISEVLMADAD
ncbi:MAG: chaperonin GroEL [Chlamydiia bacterium]|nr:chaperonin GroEL [Chlamydiia bacterium]